MHRLSERFAHQNRFSPPPRFPQASTYPRIDRLASGLPPMTSGEHTLPLTKKIAGYWFPYGFEDKLLNLAIDQNSPARFSKRKIRHCLRFHAVSVWCCMVSGSLHLSSKVLFNFHSRYYCTIGLRTYLGLEVNASQFTRNIQCTLLKDSCNPFSNLPLLGYHHLWRLFPENFRLIG